MQRQTSWSQASKSADWAKVSRSEFVGDILYSARRLAVMGTTFTIMNQMYPSDLSWPYHLIFNLSAGIASIPVYSKVEENIKNLIRKHKERKYDRGVLELIKMEEIKYDNELLRRMGVGEPVKAPFQKV